MSSNITQASPLQQQKDQEIEKIKKILNDSDLNDFVVRFFGSMLVVKSLGMFIKIRRADGNERSLDESRSTSNVGFSPANKRQKQPVKGDANMEGDSDDDSDSDEEENDDDDDDESDDEENDSEGFEPAKPMKVDSLGDADESDETKRLRQRMVEVWTNLLDEPVVPNGSQSTVGSVFNPTRTEERKIKCGFREGTKMRDALQQLYNFRLVLEEGKIGKKRKKSQSLIREETHTQYVVNRIVRAVLPQLKEWFTNHWKSGCGKAYDDFLELGFYEERIHQRKGGLRRKPDSLLYAKGTNAPVMLKNEALSVGSLVSFEHKVSLLNERMCRKALIELERDYAEKMRWFSIHKQEVGYGVMTDGIIWRSHKFRIEVEDHQNLVALHTLMSEDVRICEEKKGKVEFNFEKLAEQLLHAFQQSILVRQVPTNHTMGKATIRGQSFNIGEILDLGERRLVVKVSPIGGGGDDDKPDDDKLGDVTLKFPFFSLHNEPK